MRRIRLNPITRKRLRRFREMKRAHFSFWILLMLYAVSLCAELLCNNRPLYVRFNGQSYFPVFKFYPDDLFTGSGIFTRTDYKALRKSPQFAETAGNTLIFAPIPHGPLEIHDPAAVDIPDQVTVHWAAEPRVGTVHVNRDLAVIQATSADIFFGVPDRDLRGRQLDELCRLPEDIRQGIGARFDNRAAPRLEALTADQAGRQVRLSLTPFTVRSVSPTMVLVTIRAARPQQSAPSELVFDRSLNLVTDASRLWPDLPKPMREDLLEGVRQRFDHEVAARLFTLSDTVYRARFLREEVRFPFRPVRGHWLGLDSSGRDVLARILYGLRTSMTFGLILVSCSLFFGTVIGAVQGYFGGVLDIAGQRLIEIWSALPFLYIMILMGSVYGRSFALLIFCYALFNWIGMSYYMRAEFLRLRKQPFVEAARCMGLPTWRIVFKHVLPNALVPLITFFPFSLVGAIGALAALDYLGFGLPPPTPSWGEMLQQAQEFRWAWWLILFPSLTLFVVMLLGVFVGEGVRNAFDPRRYSRMQ